MSIFLKRLCFISILSLFSFHSFTQNTIKGKVVDEQQLPMIYAEVQLVGGDSTTIQSKYTHEAGFFSLSVDSGHYTLQINYFQKKVYSSIIQVSGNLDFYKDELESVYWIRRLKEVFSEIK